MLRSKNESSTDFMCFRASHYATKFYVMCALLSLCLLAIHYIDDSALSATTRRRLPGDDSLMELEETRDAMQQKRIEEQAKDRSKITKLIKRIRAKIENYCRKSHRTDTLERLKNRFEEDMSRYSTIYVVDSKLEKEVSELKIALANYAHPEEKTDDVEELHKPIYDGWSPFYYIDFYDNHVKVSIKAEFLRLYDSGKITKDTKVYFEDVEQSESLDRVEKLMRILVDRSRMQSGDEPTIPPPPACPKNTAASIERGQEISGEIITDNSNGVYNDATEQSNAPSHSNKTKTDKIQPAPAKSHESQVSYDDPPNAGSWHFLYNDRRTLDTIDVNDEVQFLELFREGELTMDTLVRQKNSKECGKLKDNDELVKLLEFFGVDVESEAPEKALQFAENPKASGASTDCTKDGRENESNPVTAPVVKDDAHWLYRESAHSAKKIRVPDILGFLNLYSNKRITKETQVKQEHWESWRKIRDVTVLSRFIDFQCGGRKDEEVSVVKEFPLKNVVCHMQKEFGMDCPVAIMSDPFLSGKMIQYDHKKNVGTIRIDDNRISALCDLKISTHELLFSCDREAGTIFLVGKAE